MPRLRGAKQIRMEKAVLKMRNALSIGRQGVFLKIFYSRRRLNLLL
jgi:hypothetical protein